MKIFIVYASAGAGHKQAACVLRNFLEQKEKKGRIALFDVLDYTNPFFKNCYEGSYNLMIAGAQFIWSFLYKLTSFKPLIPFFKPVYQFVNRANAARFIKLIIEEKPDVIIATHFLPAELVSWMKEKKLCHSKLATVITDFGVHPYWVNPATDIYCVATQATADLLLAFNVSKKKVCVSGIPVDPKFSNKFDKEGLSAKYSLPRNFPIVLIMTGSFGIGPIEKIASELSGSCRVLAVCAKNKKLFNTLKRKNCRNVDVFGFVDNIEELMAVADVIITKPGGLSTSEVLCSGVVPVFISPIPGQEEINVKIMADLGVGRICGPDVSRIRSIVEDALRDSALIRDSMRKIAKPCALEEVYRAIR